MKSTKIAWMESQYLFPHHFQQQERYFESLIENRVKAVTPNAWGITTLEINDALLVDGRIALTKGGGVMPDGCPFDMPANADLPIPLKVDSKIKNELVFLALPIYQVGARQISNKEASEGVSRYVIEELEVFDYCSDTANQEIIETARLQFRLVLESDNLGNFVLLPICRIAEVTQEGAVLLDKTFIPPCLSVKSNERLLGFLTEVIGVVHQRADAIANRFSDANKDKSSAAIVDFMLLQMLNGYEPLLRHAENATHAHPEQLFGLLQALCGELSTFTTKAKRPINYISYQHDNLDRCFTPIITNIGKQLSVVLEQTAVSLPIEKRQFGIFVSRLPDRTLLSQARFVVAVKSSMTQEKLRSFLPAHIKIGSVETIRDLVNNQLTGITISPLSSAPREITYHSGFLYFELDAQGEQWRSLQKSGGFAFHIAGDIPDFAIEFWAIRNN